MSDALHGDLLGEDVASTATEILASGGRVTGGSNVSLTNHSDVAMLFTSHDWDPSGCGVTTSHGFVAKRPGWYWIWVSADLTQAGGVLRRITLHDGLASSTLFARTSDTDNTSAFSTTLQTSGMIELAEGDGVAASFRQSSGGTETLTETAEFARHFAWLYLGDTAA